MARDLDRVRRDVAAMRRRSEHVAQVFESVHERWDQPGVVRAVFTVARCDRGRGGHHPELAKVYDTDAGLLYAAPIEWMPVDRLRLTPWHRDALLRNTPAATLADDGSLTDWLDHLDRWTEGLEATGDRWLRDADAVTIRDVLDAPDDWRPELWARCPDHPGDATRLDRDALLTEVRSTTRRRPTAAPPRFPPAARYSMPVDSSP